MDEFYQKEIAREMSEDEWAILDGSYTDELIEAGEDFPQLLFLSFIVTWYSFIELKLLDLCEHLKLSISISPKDNSNFGQGITKARKFLLACKDYEIDGKHWQELTTIRRFRNIIVHEGGRLSCDYFKPDRQYASHTLENGVTIYISVDETLFHYLQKHNMIRFSNPPFVDINPTFEYSKYLVEFGKEIFDKLYSDLIPGRVLKANVFSRPSRA